MRRTMPVAFILISSNAVFAMIAMVLFAHKEEICRGDCKCREMENTQKRVIPVAADRKGILLHAA